MTRYRIVLAALAAVALVAVAPEANSKGGTPITSCGQTVTTNAVLTQDLACAGSNGVVVGADRITIDLQGFAITGDRTVFTIGIWVPGFDGVTLKNGVVRNFYDGVIASGAEKFTLSNVTAAGNVFTGFSVNNSTKASLSNVTGFGSAYGIYVISNGAKITSASAIRNTNLGIAIEGDGVSIKSSSAVGNAYGISIFGDGNTVTSSAANGNGIVGIDIDGAGNSVTKATARANGSDGIHLRNGANTVSSSDASGNTGHGIHTDGSGQVINHNRTVANGYVGAGGSDLVGNGILAENYTPTFPLGKNTAFANDDPTECNPTSLC
jgi:hypothetical protein